MCPVCVANLALIAASTTSSGGLAALLTGKFFKDRIALSKCRTHVTQASSLWGIQASCLTVHQTRSGNMPARPTAKMAVQLTRLRSRFSKRANNTKHESENKNETARVRI
jgi:hypothetical protein